MKPEKFPLAWPPYLKTTEHRQDSAFKTSFVKARDGILNELKLLKATEVIISTNVQVNKQGLLADGRLVYPDPGVAVYFNYKGQQKVIACDKWSGLHENLQAVHLTIEAIRGMERWGTSDIVNQALPDLKQLTQSAGVSNGAWWLVLGVPPDADPIEIKEAYKLKVSYYHPDKPTGNRDMFEIIKKAYDEALAYKK